MNTATIKKSRKLPDFIKGHKIFGKFDTIEKIFPLIGLDNCSEKISTATYMHEIATLLRNDLVAKFDDADQYWHNRVRSLNIANLLKNCKPSDFIKNGRIIPVPTNLAELIPNINQVYFQCLYPPHYAVHQRCNYRGNRIYDPKDYSVPQDLKIVFSSDKRDGVWDIATMSMRGIKSCQSWNGSYKHNLVGSIIDPFLGVIYLTDGSKTNNGTKMIKRSLVRYVINNQTNKPALLLEKVYPNRGYYDDNSGRDSHVIELFKKFLEKKTDNKLPVITKPRGYHIPNSKIVKAMSTCGKPEQRGGDASHERDYCRSYRDSNIAYSKSSKVNFGKIKAF
jgi:hypothetical protein